MGGFFLDEKHGSRVYPGEARMLWNENQGHWGRWRQEAVETEGKRQLAAFMAIQIN